jgi:serine protease
MESAVKYARKKGTLVICAAGNDGRGTVSYPAAYDGAFAVASVGPNAKRAFYSNWGKQIQIAAPGGSSQVGGVAGGMVLQNTINRQRPNQADFYAGFQGTSMATPHVAGVAALIFSAGVTDPDDVERILKETAKDAGAEGWDPEYGAGILNAGAAVAEAQSQTHGLPYFLAGLGALGLFLVRTRKRIPFGASMLVGAVLGSSGLFFLEWFGLSGFFSQPIANWDFSLFGASFARTAIWASAIPMFIASTVMLGARKYTGLLVGLTLGWAAHLLMAAFLMPADVQLIPGIAGVLDRIWLAVNSGLLGFLAVLVGRK